MSFTRSNTFVLPSKQSSPEPRTAEPRPPSSTHHEGLHPDIRIDGNGTKGGESGEAQTKPPDSPMPNPDTPSATPLKQEQQIQRPQHRLTLIEVCRGSHTDGALGMDEPSMELRSLSPSASPDFFTRHATIGTRFAYERVMRPAVVPSRHRPWQHWEFEYFCRCFYEEQLVESPGGSAVAVCQDTGREIMCYDWARPEVNKRVTLMVLSRKCSFWSRDGCENGDSEVTILCDQLPSKICLQNQVIDLVESRFMGGCADPFSDTAELSEGNGANGQIVDIGVSRLVESMYDCLYRQFERGSPLDSSSSLHHPAAFFPLKWIASEYEHLLAFLTFRTVSMRSRGWALRRGNRHERAECTQVERDWAQFRSAEYIEALLLGIEAVGMSEYYSPSSGPPPPRRRRDSDHHRGRSRAPSPVPNLLLSAVGPRADHYLSGWESVEPDPWAALRVDLQWLYQGLRQRRLDYDRVTQSIAALASIQEAARTHLVAKKTSRITLLAVIFTPLALLAGYFSMAEIYLPGGGKGWVYPAIAVPIIAALFFWYVGWRKRQRFSGGRGVGCRDILDLAERGCLPVGRRQERQERQRPDLDDTVRGRAGDGE